jgi:prepilin-type N-terminal cleavage/methylation domain-containing protein
MYQKTIEGGLTAMAKRTTSRGFTLIELMITLVILAIVITIGVPSLSDFIASQHVRTTASDIMADMAFARAEAIKESRLVVMEPIGGAGNWKSGWRIWVDIDSDRARGADETRKSATPISGRTGLCGPATMNSGIVFRPDGRAAVPNTTLATLAPIGETDGIKVSDDLADAASTNDRVRTVFIGISGRPGVQIQDSGSATPRAVCPAFP